MKQSVLSLWNLPILPTIGLFLFATVFIGMIYWVFKKENKKRYSEAQNLPCEEGRPHVRS